MKSCVKIRPVILCGGSGSRLWPVSTDNFPKQFIEFMDNKSLFEVTLERTKRIKNSLTPLIISNQNYEFIIKNLLKKIDLQAHIILEPMNKSTVTAFYLCSKFCNDNDILLFLPCDHYIKNSISFIKCINNALENYKKDTWITFGIKPEFPHDGFGYLQISENQIHKNSDTYPIKNFIEKPSKSKAKKFLEKNNYFWNSGIFVSTAKLIQNTVKNYEKDIGLNCDKVWKYQNAQNQNIKFEPKLFKKIRSQAIDYTLMKIPEKIQMYKLDVGWNDIGSWDNFLKIYKSKNNLSNFISINSNNNYLYPTSKNVVTIDVNDLIIVDNSDSLLICKKDSSEKLKTAIEKINYNLPKKNQTTQFIKPWGFYEVLLDSDLTKIKRLHIYPNTRLSYQFHNFRNEHWIIISGEAEVKINGKIKILKQNESIYISKKTKHYIKNISKQNLILIEVQTGSYFGEDDIYRIDDPFKR